MCVRVSGVLATPPPKKNTQPQNKTPYLITLHEKSGEQKRHGPFSPNPGEILSMNETLWV